MPRARARWPPGRAAPEDVAASPPHAQPSCPWPKTARDVVVWALSQCGPHLGFLAISIPLNAASLGCEAEAAPHAPIVPPRALEWLTVPHLDIPRSWGRGGAHTASDGQARTPARAASLRPTASERAHRPRPTPPAARKVARPRPRPPPARSRPTAPRAAAGAGAACSPPPPLAAARSGPVRHLRSRPIDPSRGAFDSGAHDPQSRACFARSARVVPLIPTLLRRAARSSPVVNGRTERRKVEGAGSRHR